MAVPEPINVFDLPQLYTKPPSAALHAALASLTATVASWDAPDAAHDHPREDRSAIAAYLTKIIASPLAWLHEDDQSTIWDAASLRLSERSGRTGMPALTRPFTIPLPPPSPPLTISLHEPSMTGDNLGFKTWGAAYLLATHLPAIAAAHLAHLHSPSVLELGAGTGLLGLAASAALRAQSVLLTDLPEIVGNLSVNATANAAAVAACGGGDVGVEALDWSSVAERAHAADVVLAVDPLYAPEHPAWLARAVDACLARNGGARVVIGVSLRDGATRGWGAELKGELERRGLVIVGEGEGEGLDDWEVKGGGGVECWWGVWRRGDGVEGG